MEFTTSDAASACHRTSFSRNCDTDGVEDIISPLGSCEATSSSALTCTDFVLPSYDMSGEKILIIFNHFKFQKTPYYKRYKPQTRYSTTYDVKSLEKTFQRRGFMVIAHHDWEYQDIMKYLTDVCCKDHSDTSCVAVAVLSHGYGDCVCAADQMYPVADITHKLRAAPRLAGKPKLFFIEACRERHTKAQPPPNVPLDVHCYLLFATYEDHFSYRDPNKGTWLIQALCKEIDTHHTAMDILELTTLVNKAVSEKSDSNESKQMPVNEHNLTKIFWL